MECISTATLYDNWNLIQRGKNDAPNENVEDELEDDCN